MSALTFQALRRLADGRFHSGEEMARSLNRSRATLSEALKRAPEMGIELFSIPGKGYRVAEPIDFLDAAAIARALEARAPRVRLEVVDEIESTSTRLLEMASAGAPSGTCLAAEWQSSGRGRRGRSWVSRLGGSLTFSLLWRFDRGAGHLGGLSLAVGEAVARALSICGARRVQVKWPNDVVVDLRKLAGILVETAPLGRSRVAVIGIGINIRTQEVADAASGVGNVAEIDASATPATTLARVTPALFAALRSFDTAGFAAFADRFAARDVLRGRRVAGTGVHGDVEGIAAGIASDGSLRIDTAAGPIAVASGEWRLTRVATTGSPC